MMLRYAVKWFNRDNHTIDKFYLSCAVKNFAIEEMLTSDDV
jgi:hypothetical protein